MVEMQSLFTNLFLVLCTIATLTDAQHHHHARRKSSGLPSGVPGTLGRPIAFPFAAGSSGSPFASASGATPIPPSAAPATAPYSIGNGTAGARTGTGTGGPTGTTTLYSTRFITVEEAPVSTALASLPIGGESPISTRAAEGPGGSAPSGPVESVSGAAPSEAPVSEHSGSPASPSAVLGGLGETTCPISITVTITQDTTVTVTAPASPSQAAFKSETPVESQPIIPPAAGSNTAARAPTGTIYLTSTSVNYITPGQAATSQIPVQVMSDGLVMKPTATSARVEAATAAAEASSPASSVAVTAEYSQTHRQTASSAPLIASSTDTSPAAPVQEATQAATVLSSAMAAAYTNTAAASVAPVASSGSTSTSSSSLTPNGIKAGIAGFRTITDKPDWDKFTPFIGWYSDYFPDTPGSGKVSGIPMLWGNGHLGDQNDDGDQIRIDLFTSMYNDTSDAHPDYMFGFYEPDWTPPDSSNIDAATAASNWNTYLQPLQGKGTKLGSPSMAEQYDENGYLATFGKGAGLIGADNVPSWDYTVIHTNKPNVTGVIRDIEYYVDKYKKPVWVAEFTCVDDVHWDTCSDPTQIKNFIQQSVDYFQKNESVVAYGFNNGNGLNDTWYMFDSAGLITTAGQIYLDQIKTYV